MLHYCLIPLNYSEFKREEEIVLSVKDEPTENIALIFNGEFIHVCVNGNADFWRLYDKQCIFSLNLKL